MAAISDFPEQSTSKYKNWIKAGLAVLITKEGIEPFVYDEIEQFQHDCLRDISNINGLPAGVTCSSCCTENVVVCPTNRICNVRGKCKFHRNSAEQYLPSGCPNNICHKFKKEIQKVHRYNGPSYKNTDAREWCSNPWEVAKCFMPPDSYKDVTSAAQTDFNGVISVIVNYKDFQPKVRDDLSKAQNIFAQAREIGNRVRHSPNLEVEDTDLQHYFSILHRLLSDPAYLSTNTAAQNARTKLLKLQQDTLVIGKDDVRKTQNDYLLKAFGNEINIPKKEAEKEVQLNKNTNETIDNQGNVSIAHFIKALQSGIMKLKELPPEANIDTKQRGKFVEEVVRLGAESEGEKIKLEESTKTAVEKLEVKAEAGMKKKEKSTDKNADEALNRTGESTTPNTEVIYKRFKGEKEKPTTLESYYSESGAIAEEQGQFAPLLEQASALPHGSFIDTRDCHAKEYVYESSRRVDASSWVCMICFPGGGTGTGFRVGTKYIMTANHVVECILNPDYQQVGQTQDPLSRLQDSGVYAVFDYKADEQITDRQKFRFKALVPFKDDATDTAILELENKADGTPMPRSFTFFSLPQMNKKFTFIGHSEGKRMEFNHVGKIIDMDSKESKEVIVKLKELSLEISGHHYEFEPNNTLTNPHRYFFHCKFTKGASGSPGVVSLKDGRVVVVTMLLSGLPDWYYRESIKDDIKTKWPKKSCVEQGVNFRSVQESMIKKNEILCHEIFSAHTDTLPNPNN